MSLKELCTSLKKIIFEKNEKHNPTNNAAGLRMPTSNAKPTVAMVILASSLVARVEEGSTVIEKCVGQKTVQYLYRSTPLV